MYRRDLMFNQLLLCRIKTLLRKFELSLHQMKSNFLETLSIYMKYLASNILKTSSLIYSDLKKKPFLRIKRVLNKI